MMCARAEGFPDRIVPGGRPPYYLARNPARDAAVPACVEAPSMKFVTRARPKVDRIACPWLIRRFVDPAAEFLFVPADQVTAIAERDGAIPFDVPDVELGHHGDLCSFDAIIQKFAI